MKIQRKSDFPQNKITQIDFIFSFDIGQADCMNGRTAVFAEENDFPANQFRRPFHACILKIGFFPDDVRVNDIRKHP
ncbi:MAG: hypothetical protein IJL32_08015 [Oscillospiraceae bacterium]|nr:hypothetical protein [Oscillospiraceae bacterium]